MINQIARLVLLMELDQFKSAVSKARTESIKRLRTKIQERGVLEIVLPEHYDNLMHLCLRFENIGNEKVVKEIDWLKFSEYLIPLSVEVAVANALQEVQGLWKDTFETRALWDGLFEGSSAPNVSLARSLYHEATTDPTRLIKCLEILSGRQDGLSWDEFLVSLALSHPCDAPCVVNIYNAADKYIRNQGSSDDSSERGLDLAMTAQDEPIHDQNPEENIEWLKGNLIAQLTVSMGKLINQFFPISKVGLPSRLFRELLMEIVLNDQVSLGFESDKDPGGYFIQILNKETLSGATSKQTGAYLYRAHTPAVQTDDPFGLLKDREIQFLSSLIGEFVPEEHHDALFDKRKVFYSEQEALAQTLSRQPKRALIIEPMVTPTDLRAKGVLAHVLGAKPDAEGLSGPSLKTLVTHAKLYGRHKFQEGYTNEAIAEIHNSDQGRVRNDIFNLAQATGFDEELEQITAKNARCRSKRR